MKIIFGLPHRQRHHDGGPVVARHRQTGRRRLGRLGVVAGFAAVSLVGCGTNDKSSQAPLRSYVLHLSVDDSTEKYDYVATDPVDIRAGDEVTFELDNNGQFIHDLQIVDGSGAVLGTAAPVPVGGTGSVTVQFPTPGVYRLNCNTDNHLVTHKMFAAINVGEPENADG